MIGHRTKQMEDMYASGKTLREVGKAFGVHGERVRQLLSALGEFHYGGSSKRKDQRIEKTLALALEGKSKVQIASQLGINWNRVHSFLCQLRSEGRLPKTFTVKRS